MERKSVLESEFNGLTSAQPSLPAEWYFDSTHFARELDQIWTRNWVYLCRAETLANPCDFHRFDIAGQPVLLLRDEQGNLKGFLNTCRHRGSILCQEANGRLKKPLLVCPYHQWAYDLEGRLRATGPMRQIADFDRSDFPLFKISVAEWGGFVFANLDPEATAFEKLYGGETAFVSNWPLEDLRKGYTYSKVLKCNWKIFWENFNECLHCPNIHPELCDLVPIYGRAIMARRDDPEWQRDADNTAPHIGGGLKAGAESWSMDGTSQGRLPGLTDADVASGQRYVTITPSAFFAHHSDYVRSVKITPLTPETTEISAEWLFAPELLAQPDFDMSNITDFATLVLDQDGAACELNQEGLRARRFSQGVLMQEEYEVFLFQDWIREQLREPMIGATAQSRASRRVEATIPSKSTEK